MKEMAVATQKKILITAYWPRKEKTDEVHIGYGVSKTSFVIRLVRTFYDLVGYALIAYVEPRFRPLTKQWMRILLLFIPTLIIALLQSRISSLRGFYQLDDEGRPILFLSRVQPPESIQGRVGSSRKAFVDQL